MGQCKDADDCTEECNGKEGQITRNFGTCQCNNIVKVDDLCTIECIDNLVRKTFSDNNQIILTDPVTNTTVISTLKNTLGAMNCINKDSNKCTVDNLSMSDSENGDF